MPGEQRATASAGSPPKQVLVVEDDPASREAMRILLSGAGHRVVTAATLSEAMASIGPSVDVVVLDLMLPDGDGLQLLSHVRTVGLKARVCITTGVSNPAWLANVQQMRPDCVLMKPIDVDQLLSEL